MTDLENLYNFVAPPPREPSPVRIYKNEERLLRIQKTSSLQKADHKTMGLAQVDPAVPTNFLRKNARSLRPRFLESDEPYCGARLCLEQDKKAAVPDHFFRYESSCPKNFVRDNVQEAGQWSPFPLVERVVDGRRGNVVNVDRTVLRPVYLGHEGFGKVPRCVQKFMDKAQRQQSEAEAQRSADEAQRVQDIFNNRDRLGAELKRAKEEWDEKNKEFLLLPVITDTLVTKKKRYQLEMGMAFLEDKIDSLKHQFDQASEACRDLELPSVEE